MASRRRQIEIGDHIDLLTGFPFRSELYTDEPQDIRLLRGDNVVQGVVRWEGVKRWPASRATGLDRYQLAENDIVIAMDRTWVKAGLKIAQIRASDLPCLLVQRVARLRTRNGLDQNYLAHCINSCRFEQYVKGNQTETAVPHISSQQLSAFTIHIPSIEEQRQIAALLRAWDEAIDKNTRLLDIKARLYSWHAEALLAVPTLKLHSNHKRSAKPLSRFTNELTERNATNALRRDLVMGVSNANGLVPMREQTIGSDLSRYKILPPKAFAYNPMRINVGSIAMSRFDSDVLVSPDYVLFACKKGVLDPDYFDHLCNTHWWKHHINESGSGSVRQRIYYDNLAALRIVIPSFEKQKQIANCLNHSRREIELLEAQIAALKQQKRGLMQKLLTGVWRLTP